MELPKHTYENQQERIGVHHVGHILAKLGLINNKISTLGVAFAALEQENIQICHSSANQHNINNYSEECDFFYLFSINDYL